MEDVRPQLFEHDIETGLVSEATQIHSPNFDARPGEMSVDLIVIHAISLPPKHFGGNYVEDLFTNQLDVDADPFFRKIANIKFSSHFYIKRDGHLKQFVSTNDRAWHAGISCYHGREKVNDFSIGIELEGCDESPFEIIQYQVLASLTRSLESAFPSISNIVGHRDISPGRKTDPGPCFNWDYFFKICNK